MSLIGVESGVTPRSIPTGVSRVFRGRSIRFTDGNGIKFRVYDDNGSAYIMADVNPLIINHPPNPCPPIEPVVNPPILDLVSSSGTGALIAGIGVPGAEIIVNGDPTGVIADEQGRFTIFLDPIQPEQIHSISQESDSIASSDSYLGVISQRDECPIIVQTPIVDSVNRDGDTVSISGIGTPGAEVLIDGEPTDIIVDEQGRFTVIIENSDLNYSAAISLRLDDVESPSSYVTVSGCEGELIAEVVSIERLDDDNYRIAIRGIPNSQIKLDGELVTDESGSVLTDENGYAEFEIQLQSGSHLISQLNTIPTSFYITSCPGIGIPTPIFRSILSESQCLENAGLISSQAYFQVSSTDSILRVTHDSDAVDYPSNSSRLIEVPILESGSYSVVEITEEGSSPELVIDIQLSLVCSPSIPPPVAVVVTDQGESEIRLEGEDGADIRACVTYSTDPLNQPIGCLDPIPIEDFSIPITDEYESVTVVNYTQIIGGRESLSSSSIYFKRATTEVPTITITNIDSNSSLLRFTGIPDTIISSNMTPLATIGPEGYAELVVVRPGSYEYIFTRDNLSPSRANVILGANTDSTLGFRLIEDYLTITGIPGTQIFDDGIPLGSIEADGTLTIIVSPGRILNLTTSASDRITQITIPTCTPPDSSLSLIVKNTSDYGVYRIDYSISPEADSGTLTYWTVDGINPIDLSDTQGSITLEQVVGEVILTQVIDSSTFRATTSVNLPSPIITSVTSSNIIFQAYEGANFSIIGIVDPTIEHLGNGTYIIKNVRWEDGTSVAISQVVVGIRSPPAYARYYGDPVGAPIIESVSQNEDGTYTIIANNVVYPVSVNGSEYSSLNQIPLNYGTNLLVNWGGITNSSIYLPLSGPLVESVLFNDGTYDVIGSVADELDGRITLVGEGVEASTDSINGQFQFQNLELVNGTYILTTTTSEMTSPRTYLTIHRAEPGPIIIRLRPLADGEGYEIAGELVPDASLYINGTLTPYTTSGNQFLVNYTGQTNSLNSMYWLINGEQSGLTYFYVPDIIPRPPLITDITRVDDQFIIEANIIPDYLVTVSGNGEVIDISGDTATIKTILVDGMSVLIVRQQRDDNSRASPDAVVSLFTYTDGCPPVRVEAPTITGYSFENGNIVLTGTKLIDYLVYNGSTIIPDQQLNSTEFTVTIPIEDVPFELQLYQMNEAEIPSSSTQFTGIVIPQPSITSAEDGIITGVSGSNSVTILYTTDGIEVDSVTSNSQGNFQFTNVQPGNYFIQYEIGLNTYSNPAWVSITSCPLPPPSIEIVSYTSALDFRIEFLVDSSTDSVVVSQNGIPLFTILPDQFGNFILDSNDIELPSGTYEAYRVVDSETSPHISFAVNATCPPDLNVSLAIRYQPEEETDLFIIIEEVIDELEYSLDYGESWTIVNVDNNPSTQYSISLPYEGDYTIYPRGSIIIRATRDGVTRDVALDQGTISPGIIAIDNIEVVESITRLRLHSIPDSVIMVSIDGNTSPSVNTNSCGQAELSVNLTECGVTYQVCLTTLELADYSRCEDLSRECPPTPLPLPEATYQLIGEDVEIIVPSNEWSEYYLFSRDGGETWTSSNQLLGGIYENIEVVIERDGMRGPIQYLGSIITPYRPYTIDFDIIDNSTWQVSFNLPSSYQVSVVLDGINTGSTYIGNNYEYVTFNIPATTSVLTLVLDNPDGTLTGSTDYVLPVVPVIDSVTLNSNRPVFQSPHSPYTLQHSQDGGITWISDISDIVLPDGVYNYGSILFRYVISGVNYHAEGPTITTLPLFSPYVIVDGSAILNPGSSDYLVSGVGPVGSIVSHLESGNSVTITDPLGQFVLLIPAEPEVTSLDLTLTQPVYGISSINSIPITTIPECPPDVDGRLIMGFDWTSITAPSSATAEPIITIIGLLPSTSYTLLDITSYAGSESTGSGTTVNVNLPITTNASGILTYRIIPIYFPVQVHPYIRLLIGAEVMVDQDQPTTIIPGLVTFQVRLQRAGEITSYVDTLAYY